MCYLSMCPVRYRLQLQTGKKRRQQQNNFVAECFTENISSAHYRIVVKRKYRETLNDCYCSRIVFDAHDTHFVLNDVRVGKIRSCSNGTTGD